MEITWSNFWFSPVALGTLFAGVATLIASFVAVGIAIALEKFRRAQIRRERESQANVIFAVLAPPLGEISAAAERALGDPRLRDPQAFAVALNNQDPVFELPIPDVMLRVFDRLHLLPPLVAQKVSMLYSDLLGWQRVFVKMGRADAVQLHVIKAMPAIYSLVNQTVTEVVHAARKAKLPVEGLEDIT